MLAIIGKPYIPSWSDQSGYLLGPFAPELVLIITIIAVLLVPFFTPRRSNGITALVALLGLAVAFFAVIYVHVGFDIVDKQFVGMLITDRYSLFFKGLLLLFTMGVVLMWFSTTGSQMHEGDGPEFFTLLLGATLGMCLMASTTNLLMIFMAVEMASLPSYVLSGFRKTDRIGSEASLKYVLFGAATSAIMVYGMSMLYGLFGSLQLEDIAHGIAQTALGGISLPLIVGIAGVIVGVGFKISAVPFHFWCPDVFEGAGVDVSVFLSVASKGAGLSLLLRAVMTLADGAGLNPANSVLVGTAITIGILGAVTMTVGNAGALVQNNIKRLLAYSSIAHAGYMLCALSLMVTHPNASDPGQIATSVAQSILIYLAIYLFMNLGAFTVAGLIYRATGSEDIRDYAGLGRRNPFLALCMATSMVSLIGVPPLAGFAAKFFLMAVLAHGWWWLLVAAIGINTVNSVYYYVRVLRQMYLVDSGEPPLAINPLGTLLSGVCALMLLLMLVAFYPLESLTRNFSKLYLPPGRTPSATLSEAPATPEQTSREVAAARGR